MGKHTFVFGAGASHASANTPLGNYLIWDYHLDCSLMHPLDRGNPLMEEDNESFKTFREFLEMCEAYFPELKGIVEKFDSRGIYFFTPPYLHNKRHFPDELLAKMISKEDEDGLRLVRSLIAEHIIGAAFSNRNQLYKTFVRKQLLSEPEPVIISLNFDFLIHEDFKAKVYFDYGMHFDWIDTNRQGLYRPDEAIPLLKLHGSLDWTICKECRQVSLLFPHLQKDYFRSAVCHKCGKKIEPFIVVPHEVMSQGLKGIWKQAAERLAQTEKLTVIGYSFPEYDHKVSKLFQDNLPTNTIVHIVDYTDSEKQEQYRNDLLKKFNNMFAGHQVYVSVYGFEGYLKEIGISI